MTFDPRSEEAALAADSLTQDLLAAIRRPPGLAHRDDVAWWEATLPRRWHRCSVQTSGLGAQRCACGAISMDEGRHWMEKNQTRKGRRRKLAGRRPGSRPWWMPGSTYQRIYSAGYDVGWRDAGAASEAPHRASSRPIPPVGSEE